MNDHVIVAVKELYGNSLLLLLQIGKVNQSIVQRQIFSPKAKRGPVRVALNHHHNPPTPRLNVAKAVDGEINMQTGLTVSAA